MMHHVKTGRDPRLPYKRYAAYRCSLDASGEAWIGSCVNRWYGTFTEKTLCNEVMPYLKAKYIAKVWSYPFLITSYMLDELITVNLPVFPDRKTTAKDIRFPRRKRKNKEKRVAVVLSPTEYKLL